MFTEFCSIFENREYLSRARQSPNKKKLRNFVSRVAFTYSRIESIRREQDITFFY